MSTDPVRCEPCLGLGYKGRWRRLARGREVEDRSLPREPCRACGGTGTRPAPAPRHICHYPGYDAQLRACPACKPPR